MVIFVEYGWKMAAILNPYNFIICILKRVTIAVTIALCLFMSSSTWVRITQMVTGLQHLGGPKKTGPLCSAEILLRSAGFFAEIKVV